MLLRDFSRLSLSALFASPVRTTLTALGVAVGIAAVVLLTSIGEGVHRYVLSEFTQFGTHLIAVTPGKTSTHGIPGGIFGTVRPLTLRDSESMRNIAGVIATVPFLQGNAEVEAESRSRRTTIMGVGPDMPEVWQLRVAMGKFLPRGQVSGGGNFAVLGAKMRHELFGQSSPLGKRLRVGGDRYRIIGVLEPKGEVLGFDLDDTVYVPASRAMELFDRESLMEADVLYSESADAEEIARQIRRMLIARHGREDFTITTQQQMLDVLGSVLNILTFAVGALGGISLLVGGVGILAIMTIAVAERTGEVGLLRALGASRGLVLLLFLGEAGMVSAVGGLAGLALGFTGAQLIHLAVPALPVYISWAYALLAEGIAVAIGVVAGVLPARRAAGLDPVEALRAE